MTEAEERECIQCGKKVTKRKSRAVEGGRICKDHPSNGVAAKDAALTHERARELADSALVKKEERHARDLRTAKEMQESVERVKEAIRITRLGMRRQIIAAIYAGHTDHNLRDAALRDFVRNEVDKYVEKVVDVFPMEERRTAADRLREQTDPDLTIEALINETPAKLVAELRKPFK